MIGLHKTFLDELGDILHVEELLLKSLPKMRDAANAPDLKSAIESHLATTQKQSARLHKVFAALDLPAREKKCEAMLGLLVEAQQLMQRSKKTAVLDAALACALRKIESYEVISYGTLVKWAKLVEEKEAAKLLAQTLDEEEKALGEWEKLADVCNERAAEEVPEPAGSNGSNGVRPAVKKPVPAFGNIPASWRF
jgi:ferritin-like metal-binding protein YciE